jgi:hypothetical protein
MEPRFRPLFHPSLPQSCVRRAFGGLVLIATLAATALLHAADVRRLLAVRDFQPAEGEFAPWQRETRDADPSAHGLAVNPKIAQDRFAAAETIFQGDAGLYTVRLHAIAEEDGESVYELVVDGQSFGRRTNPRVAEKRVPVAHVWADVRLVAGTRLRVLFAGRSNGLYPEGDSFAWSRGRWRSVEFVRQGLTQ